MGRSNCFTSCIDFTFASFLNFSIIVKYGSVRAHYWLLYEMVFLRVSMIGYFQAYGSCWNSNFNFLDICIYCMAQYIHEFAYTSLYDSI